MSAGRCRILIPHIFQISNSFCNFLFFMWTFIDMLSYTYIIHTYIHTYICVYICVYVHIYMYTYIYIYMHMYLYTHMCVFVCVLSIHYYCHCIMEMESVHCGRGVSTECFSFYQYHLYLTRHRHIPISGQQLGNVDLSIYRAVLGLSSAIWHHCFLHSSVVFPCSWNCA